MGTEPALRLSPPLNPSYFLSKLGIELAWNSSMRVPRSIQLYEAQGCVHQYWRCHNREFYLQNDFMKALYLNCVIEALRSHGKNGCVKIHAYTCMDNHFHNVTSFDQGSQKFSAFLRQAHSLFGARYNKIHKRSGKVAEGRPKTPLIENSEHQMRVQFYVEANSIRTGKYTERTLRFNKYSSYRFYAYGIHDAFTNMLTTPDWYIELGKNDRERQHRYRTLFLEYLKLTLNRTEFFQLFIGSAIWKIRRISKIVEMLMTQSDLKPG